MAIHTVLFFANMAEQIGAKKLQLELPESTPISIFKHILLEQFPNFAGSLSCALIAVNREFASDADIIPSGAEIALFPMVSGGTLLVNYSDFAMKIRYS